MKSFLTCIPFPHTLTMLCLGANPVQAQALIKIAIKQIIEQVRFDLYSSDHRFLSSPSVVAWSQEQQCPSWSSAGCWGVTHHCPGDLLQIDYPSKIKEFTKWSKLAIEIFLGLFTCLISNGTIFPLLSVFSGVYSSGGWLSQTLAFPPSQVGTKFNRTWIQEFYLLLSYSTHGVLY